MVWVYDNTGVTGVVATPPILTTAPPSTDLTRVLGICCSLPLSQVFGGAACATFAKKESERSPRVPGSPAPATPEPVGAAPPPLPVRPRCQSALALTGSRPSGLGAGLMQ